MTKTLRKRMTEVAILLLISATGVLIFVRFSKNERICDDVCISGVIVSSGKDVSGHSAGLAEPISNAFVFLQRKSGDWRLTAPAGNVRLEFKNHIIVPQVCGVLAGQEVVLHSSVDSTAEVHSPHFISANNQEYLGSLQTKPTPTSYTFSNAEVFIKLRCDLHPDEVAYLGVVDNPYFAVTNDKGEYLIPGRVPPGKYVLQVQHKLLGRKEMEIQVAEKSLIVNVEYLIDQ